MKFQFLEKLDTLRAEGPKLICLKEIRKITEEDLKDPKWRAVYDLHVAHENSDSNTKGLICVIAAAVAHNRAVFMLTRDDTFKMARNNPNWEKRLRPTFKNKPSTWTNFLREGYNSGLLKFEGRAVVDGRPRTAYSIIDPGVLSLIKADHSAQLEETLEFIKKRPGDNESGDEKRDGEGDVVLSSKQSVIKKEEISIQSPALVVSEPVHTPVSVHTPTRPMDDEQTDTGSTTVEFIELCGLAERLYSKDQQLYTSVWSKVRKEAATPLLVAFPDMRAMEPDLINYALYCFVDVTSDPATDAEKREGVARYMNMHIDAVTEATQPVAVT